MSTNLSRAVSEAAEYLRARLPARPDLALVLGSGLGGLADRIEDPVYIPYGQIPHFPVSTAPGHAGRFVFGRLSGRMVLCMQGRFHYYEGHDMAAIALPVRVLKALGCRALVLTNAAGGVNWDFSVGDFMLITDHINFMGANPLRGENDDAIGPRFCDMTHVYTPEFQQTARQVAAQQGITLREGVYLGYMGPSFETPAEIRAVRALGGDAVGMSTAPEVIVAGHCGMEVLGITLLSNMAAGILDQPLTEEEVLRAGETAREKFSALIRACLRKM